MFTKIAQEPGAITGRELVTLAAMTAIKSVHVTQTRSHQLQLFADDFQFYLQDETAAGDLSVAWDATAVQRMFAVANGVIGLGTVRNMDVPVTLGREELLRAHVGSPHRRWRRVEQVGKSEGSVLRALAGSGSTTEVSGPSRGDRALAGDELAGSAKYSRSTSMPGSLTIVSLA
ncbi:hypothetical protein [Cupriavidus sp. PET2-C1]